MQKPRIFFAVIVCGTLSLLLLWYVVRQYHRSTTLQTQVVERILKASQNIAKTSRLCSSGASSQLLIDTYIELNYALELLDQKNLNHLSDTQSDTKTNTDSCQEKFVNERVKSSNRSHFIYYRKGGFYLQKCSVTAGLHTFLTLVYNFVHYDPKYYEHIPKIIHEVNTVYPNVKVIAAIPEALDIKQDSFKDTVILTVESSVAEPDIWNKLIAKVRTKYVYIGRNVVQFTWFDRLERLVGEINNLEASVVASAYRTLKGGQWSNGCEQSVLSNYMLVYRHGYDISKQECLVCHHVHGPFVAKTELLHKVPLRSKVSSTSAFAIWFLKLKELSKSVVSCPDAMAYVTDESCLPTTKQDWTDLAYASQVEHIRLNREQVLDFSCSEAKTSCPAVRAAGKALSICCKKELSDAIKLVMTKCREGGMLCQLNAGTALGAVKFNSVIPWEMDADILIHPDNLTTFDALEPFFTNLGYKWESYPDHVLVFSPNWKVELYTDDIEIPWTMGITPTVIDFDGDNVETTINPGLFARNSYGQEIYQHVQHWLHIARGDKWGFYSSNAKKFSECPTPGHHACLDQFIPDGSLIFQEPVL